MPNQPDWMVRLQRWPIGLVGEFLGTRLKSDPQARAARRWLRKLLKTDAECLALGGILMDKGLITREEYEAAVQIAARGICLELEREFPGIVARDDGVAIGPEFIKTGKDWPK